MHRPSDKTVFADPCLVADTLVARFKGLMGRAGLPAGSGMFLAPCNSVHTFFMRFVIDVVYLAGRGPADDGEQYRVVSVRRHMRPWRAHWPVAGATAVLELPDGGAMKLNEGDLLCLS